MNNHIKKILTASLTVIFIVILSIKMLISPVIEVVNKEIMKPKTWISMGKYSFQVNKGIGSEFSNFVFSFKTKIPRFNFSC